MFRFPRLCAMPPQQIRMSGSSRFRLVAVQLGRRLIERRRRPVAAGREGSFGCLRSHGQGCHGLWLPRRLPLRDEVDRAMGAAPRYFTRRPRRGGRAFANTVNWQTRVPGTRFGRGNPAVAGRVIVSSETAPLGRRTLSRCGFFYLLAEAKYGILSLRRAWRHSRGQIRRETL